MSLDTENKHGSVYMKSKPGYVIRANNLSMHIAYQHIFLMQRVRVDRRRRKPLNENFVIKDKHGVSYEYLFSHNAWEAKLFKTRERAERIVERIIKQIDIKESFEPHVVAAEIALAFRENEEEERETKELKEAYKGRLERCVSIIKEMYPRASIVLEPK